MHYYAPDGQMYEKRIGSRAQVMHGTAYYTGGGLTANDLFYDNNNRIRSIKASKSAKANKNLGDYLAKPGSRQFVLRQKSF